MISYTDLVDELLKSGGRKRRARSSETSDNQEATARPDSGASSREEGAKKRGRGRRDRQKDRRQDSN